MHIAPVVLVQHRLGPEGWSKALAAVAETLNRHPDLTLTVRASGAVLEHAVRSEPRTWGRLAIERILWLAGGYSDPVLTALPPAAERLQLTRESTAMDLAGIRAGGLWVGDAWEPGLVSTALREGHHLVFLSAALFRGLPERPGPVERAGEAVVAVPVTDSVPDDGVDSSDGMVAVRVEPTDLEEFTTAHRAKLVSPDTYLADHLPGDRLAPRLASPARDPDRETFYRKLLLLVRDQGDRGTSRDVVLRLLSREYLLGGHPVDAYDDLVAARSSLDRAMHRGDTWALVSEVDWDADGIDEVHVETAAASLVVDPAAGSLDYWDDKAAGWAVTAVDPPMVGLLIRRLTDRGDEAHVEPMRLESRATSKTEASITLAAPSGTVCRLDLVGPRLGLEIEMPKGEPARLGPEIPIWLDRPQLRVDGGSWAETSEPVAVSGHRFRLADDTRTLLIASQRPCQLFVRPLPGRGIVIWPHWLTVAGTYRISFEPA
jgi:hypothetical protein